MWRRPMYHSSIRPKKSPAPGDRSESSASATVISMYSAVISSAALVGIDGSSRSIIRSRDDAREREVSPLGVEVGEEIGRHGVGQLSGV